MKRIFIIAISALSLTLFSFVAPTGNGVTKVGANLFEVSSTAKFTTEEQNQILEVLKTQYHITDLSACTSGKIGVKPITNAVQKKGSFYEWYAYSFAVLYRAYTWESVAPSNEDPSVVNLKRILTRYASMP